jgi:hypothetical protein
MQMESEVSFDKNWMITLLLVLRALRRHITSIGVGYRYGFSCFDSVLVACICVEER